MPDNQACIHNIINEIENNLRFHSKMGCRGFECSKKSIHIINSWGKPETLDLINNDIFNCKRCRISETRNITKYGYGNPKAKLVIINDMPDFDNDEADDPFHGTSGGLLKKIVEAINLNPESIYICNLINCHPPHGRDPFHDEIDTCLSFLKRKIKVIQPKFICVFGSITAQALTNSEENISGLRGRFHDYFGIKLMATYSPSYLINHPDKKREVWEDMKMLMKAYKE